MGVRAVSCASNQQLQGATSTYLPHQQPGCILPSTGITLQKQLEHAKQQSEFTDSPGLMYVHPSRPASSGSFTHATPAPPPEQTHLAGFQTSSQPVSCHTYLKHSQG
eukprot:gi/632960524/ref/XP_007896243.1/ PREDICTED: G protein pathway suppressor 2-like [Callorhinchus milii]